MASHRMLLLLFAVVLSANCSVAPKPSLTGERHEISEITLQRSGSWGLKSEYRVTFRKDGTAEYQGDVHAKLKGKYRGKISNDQFEQLARLIIANDFFSLEDKYQALLTDIDMVTTSVVYAGGRKAVEDFGRGGGERLTQIESEIDKTAELIAWETLNEQATKDQQRSLIFESRTRLSLRNWLMPMKGDNSEAGLGS